MGFMDYPNQTGANVLSQEGFQELVESTFNTVAEIVSKSLGPLGSESIILEGMYTTATKDGFAIFKNIKFGNIYKSLVYKLIAAPCTKLNNTVGDGTTSAIMLTKHLLSAYKEMKDSGVLQKQYRLPREFNQAWDKVIADIVAILKESAVPLSKDYNDPDAITAYDIAKVSSNGNEEISRNIREIYEKSSSPTIKLKNSPTNKCYIEAIDGFTFPTNLADEACVTNDDLSTDEKDVAVLLFNYKIDRETFENVIVPINNVYRAEGTKLLIIAPAYDELLVKTVLTSYANAEFSKNGGKVNLLISQYAYSKLENNQLEDLAAVIGCKIIDRDVTAALTKKFADISEGEIFEYLTNEAGDEITKGDLRIHIGGIPNAHLTITDGAVFSGFDTEHNQMYQNQLKRAIRNYNNIVDATDNDKKNYASDIAKAKARVGRLKMESYTYYIGADSSLQADVIWDTVDDVIKAVSSASKFGIIPGCQIMILSACEKLLKLKYERGEDDIYRMITTMIEIAAHSLYSDVLNGPNKDGIERAGEALGCQLLTSDVIRKSVETKLVYDMQTLEYNPRIVTSVETDINILQAAGELVRLLISGNQCLYVNQALNSSETIDV